MQPSLSAIAPISCTSKWRMPIARLPVSRTSAKHSGSRLVERLALRGALAQRVHPLAQLGVGVVFELGLEGADQRDALLVGLELLRLADVERAIQQMDTSLRVALGGTLGSACDRAQPRLRPRGPPESRSAGRLSPSPGESARQCRLDRARARLAAVAALVAVALDLARELQSTPGSASASSPARRPARAASRPSDTASPRRPGCRRRAGCARRRSPPPAARAPRPGARPCPAGAPVPPQLVGDRDVTALDVDLHQGSLRWIGLPPIYAARSGCPSPHPQ